MKRSRSSTATALLALVLFLATALGLAAWIGSGAGAGTHAAASRIRATQRAKLAALSVPFVANRGQVDHRVAFYASTFAGTAFVTRSGSLVLSIPAAASRSGKVEPGGWTLVESPVNAARIDVSGQARSRTRVSEFQGRHAAHWRAALPAYARVRVGRPWPGIRYALIAHGDNVERIFTVAAGADAGAIRMHVAGAKALAVQGGRLVAVTGNGPVMLSRPVAYQRVGGRRHSVPVHFRVGDDTYGFQLGAHDPHRAVVIDPIIRATYLGGTDEDAANAIAIAAANGNVYLAGRTTSANFPGTKGGAEAANVGSADAFVALLSPDLTKLVQATYFGGSGSDLARAIALGPSGSAMAGDVYIAGNTTSTDLPGTSGGAQAACAGGASKCTSNGDGFVAVLSPDLTKLIQATYLGGSGIDDVHALAVAPSSSAVAGQVYVGGRTLSSDFPGTTGGAQPQPVTAGAYSGFVARLSADLTQLTQSSYLGGSGADGIDALLVSAASGNVYAAGSTGSMDFPCTQAGGPSPNGGGACLGGTAGAQSALGGAFDAFVSLFNPTLTGLVQSTYFGGSDLDAGYALAFAPSGSPTAGELYLAGSTLSTDLPGTSGAAQPQNAGGDDGFVARFSANLQTLKSSTYIGGSADDEARAVTMASGGSLYAAGSTLSTDFPCTTPTGPAPAGLKACASPHAGAQYAAGGGMDGFVALLSPDLTSLDQATYVGGASDDQINAVALAPSASTLAGAVYATGETQSANVPATSGAAQAAYAGTADGVAAALTPGLQGPQVTLNLSVTPPGTVTAGAKAAFTVTVTNASAPSTTTSGTDATNVHFLDVVNKAGTGTFTYESASASQGSTCHYQIGVVSCNLGTLKASGGTATVTVNVKASSPGSVSSGFGVLVDQALTSASNDSVTTTSTVKAGPASGGGGGGAVAPLILVLLTAVAAIASGLRSDWRR